ncbi:PhoU domain-containing protein [Paraburkholderia mimosarum]|uniref:PhoU domain-containing protein n=2 Tax=Paraburkholderia mimosarum TaxID=312026 RepID=UPI003CC5462D
MLRTARDVFARMNTVAAPQIVRYDAVIGNEFRDFTRTPATEKTASARVIPNGLEYLVIGRDIERIGEHEENRGVHCLPCQRYRHSTCDEGLARAKPRLKRPRHNTARKGEWFETPRRPTGLQKPPHGEATSRASASGNAYTGP